MSTEANKTSITKEKNSILRELDELVEYMDQDAPQEQEELMDPAFFIGNMDEAVTEVVPDVPTLTTVANEVVQEQPKVEEPQKQPGLFSARVERLKQGVSEVPTEPENNQQEIQAVQDTELNEIIDQLVAENLPKIEAQLRERILGLLRDKKGF